MGVEMIKDKLVITPQRLYSLVRTIHQLDGLKRSDLVSLLQPSALTNNRDTANILLRYARYYALIAEDDSRDSRVRLQISPNVIASYEDFRVHMQTVLLGVTGDSADNFLLNQFAAWYATQDEQVMTYSRADCEVKFHQALYANSSERVLAEQPGLSAWQTWAEFLGWGWPIQFERREETRIVPDATLRVQPLLDKLLPHDSKAVQMGVFMKELAEACPELDGGVLFERCWQASRGNEQRGNRLSLMLTTALRVLDARGEIEVMPSKDASENWALFPSQSRTNTVTHIRRKAAD